MPVRYLNSGSTFYMGEDPDERPFKNHESIAELLMYTNVQDSLMTTIRELHGLTDRFCLYKTSQDISRADLNLELPLLLSRLMESKEKAKRMYRTTLTSKFSEREWTMDELFVELEIELERTSDMLRLYPRRGGYY